MDGSFRNLLIVQIPCLNEETTLPATIAELPREVDGFERVEWLVIDDGSTDATVEVAKQLGVDHIVSHDRNRGLAAAYMTGLERALQLGADVVVNTDADNQYDASFIGAITAPVVNGKADLVVGERPIEQVEEFSRAKKILQRFGSRVVRAFSGTEVKDAASGFRAVSRDAAIRLRVFGRYTYTMETLVQAGWEGLTVISIPVGVNAKTRESRLVKSIPRYVFRSAITIIRAFALYKPFRLFLILSSPFFAIGFSLWLRWLFLYFFSESYSSRLPGLVTGLVFLAIGAQLLILGIIADLISVNRRVLSEVAQRLRVIESDKDS